MDKSERFKKAKTAVFWDVDGCEIPDDRKAIDVSQKIRLVLEKKGYRGSEATIYAYGDTKQMLDRIESSATFEPLENSGDRTDMDTDYHGTGHIFADNSHESPAIVFNHTPAGDKDLRLKKLLIDLFCWALDNPGPANLMIILEDISTLMEFIPTFHHLIDSGYNIILVQPKNAPPRQLLGAVGTKLLWESLLVGRIDIIPCVGRGEWKSIAGVGVGVGVLIVLARLCQRSR